MSKKIKGSRSLDDINAEYSLSCGQLGDYSYRRGVLAREIEKLTKRLGELDLEAAHAKQAMAKEAPQEEPAEEVAVAAV